MTIKSTAGPTTASQSCSNRCAIRGRCLIARLYTVSVTGGPAQPLPMPEAGSGAFSPDGAKMVYSPQSRDFRTEKRYGGGQANQLYIFDLKTFDAKKNQR